MNQSDSRRRLPPSIVLRRRPIPSLILREIGHLLNDRRITAHPFLWVSVAVSISSRGVFQRLQSRNEFSLFRGDLWHQVIFGTDGSSYWDCLIKRCVNRCQRIVVMYRSCSDCHSYMKTVSQCFFLECSASNRCLFDVQRFSKWISRDYHRKEQRYPLAARLSCMQMMGWLFSWSCHLFKIETFAKDRSTYFIPCAWIDYDREQFQLVSEHPPWNYLPRCFPTFLRVGIAKDIFQHNSMDQGCTKPMKTFRPRMSTGIFYRRYFRSKEWTTSLG